jgi:uncharacterized protein (UPF0261 family)
LLGKPEAQKMSILLVGTLDTKGIEVAYVRQQLATAQLSTIVLDAGIMGEPAFAADFSRDLVFRAARTSHAAVHSVGDRGKAIEAAAIGTAEIAQKLYREGKITGIIGLGGSAGTTIATAAMRALPVGVPKVMVSTLASGDVRPYVGTRDIFMLHSVVDLAGLNRVSSRILSNAASAMIGMIQQPPLDGSDSRPIIAASMFGVTTPCVEAARKILETAGYELLVFHATGTGGQTMEGLIRDGLIAGVLDITTTELADQLAGGVMAAGVDRLTAAGLRRIPQVISLGALDMVNFGPPTTVPSRYQNRQFHSHNPNVTLMRTTAEELDCLGKEIAEKACAAAGPTRVMLPLRGLSALDRVGQPFWDPNADSALFQSLRNWTYPPELLIEVDAHINDPAFATQAAETLLKMIQAHQPKS